MFVSTTIAIVIDNRDPDKRHRIKVKFVTDSVQGMHSESSWCRMLSPMGGPRRGLVMLPEVGTEVIVGFAYRSMTPYILGSAYNGKDLPEPYRNDDCLNNCNRARCGDGYVNRFSEDCDLGVDRNRDEPNAECRTDCSDRRCGDGIVNNGEVCDDGNNSDNDACLTNCTLPPLGSTPQRPGLDCRTILADQPNAPTGRYWIDPDGEGGEQAFSVDCQMGEDGGWVVLRLSDADGIVVAEYSISNPWRKCGDNAGAPFSTNEDRIIADSSPNRYHRHDVALNYDQPSTEAPYSAAQMRALRSRLTELHPDTRMVALTADDDNGNYHGGARWGHEVYIEDARGDWVLLSPGTNGECGGGTGWPSRNSQSAIYYWHTTDAASEVSGQTGINSEALLALEPKDLLPERVRLEVHTGGGAAFGFAQRNFLVR